MTFIDYRLSDRVRTGFSGGPQWNTRVTPLASGNENRNAEWAMPAHKFTADYVLLEPQEQNAVLEAFWVARGQLHTFRFKDWNDFKIRDESLGVGDGGSVARQLIKTYTFGPSTYVRSITAPIASTLVVTANGAPLAVTVDDETGLITPSSTWPSGQAIAVDYCEFDVKVRFGADFYPFTQELWKIGKCTIDLVERTR